MNVNAVKLVKYTTLGALGGLTGIYVARKHAKKVNLQQENDYFESIQAKAKKKNTAGRLLGAAIAALATVTLLKTPAGKKVLDKAKTAIKPFVDKFKVSKFGQKIFKSAAKVEEAAKPAIEKGRNFVHKNFEKLSQTKTANKIYDFGKNIVDKFKNSPFGQKATNGIKNLIAKFK